MQVSHELLVDATQKLIELHDDSRWAKQLPIRCPPVLWFGNAASQRRKVLTIGANPSRKEFLTDSAARAIEKVLRSGDQSLLDYREPPDANRFRVLCGGERLSDILASRDLQSEIIASYDSYFTRNPYVTWFGHDRDDSYWVEGFLRGFGASYYEGAANPLQAVHIDLLPFTTLEDFGQIQEIAEAALFQGWAQEIVGRLIEWFSPEALILFGRTNHRYFAKYIDPSVLNLPSQRFRNGYYSVGRSKRFGTPIAALSTNLGNPKGFDASALREYGARTLMALQESAASGE